MLAANAQLSMRIGELERLVRATVSAPAFNSSSTVFASTAPSGDLAPSETSPTQQISQSMEQEPVSAQAD
jgi:hypothetical protein